MTHDFPRSISSHTSLFRYIRLIAFAAAIVITASFIAPQRARAIALIGGQTFVRGVTELNVNGVLRTFEFVDGTCAQVFLAPRHIKWN